MDNRKTDSPNKGFSSANPPKAPGGLASPLQPGGTRPGGSPAMGTGSIGNGGGQTKGEPSGTLKNDER